MYAGGAGAAGTGGRIVVSGAAAAAALSSRAGTPLSRARTSASAIPDSPRRTNRVCRSASETPARITASQAPSRASTSLSSRMITGTADWPVSRAARRRRAPLTSW